MVDQQSPPIRFRVVPRLLTFVLTLPILLSPSHPVAVYAYLAHACVAPFISTEGEHLHEELAEFLIAPEQLDGYRTALRADLVDRRSGGLFAVVRGADGALRHAPLRTWNSFLPVDLPPWLGDWMDRKELPYLSDAVALWLAGDIIVAIGHYHPFGGGPSPGDLTAQAFSRHAEVVVANGVVPMVYLEGDVIPYGHDVTMPKEVFRRIRALEKGLLMEVKDVPVAATEPSDRMASLMAYLRDYRGVNLADEKDVARELVRLCAEFRHSYQYVFEEGFQPFLYEDDPDTHTLLRNLQSVEMWAATVSGMSRSQLPPTRKTNPA